MKKIIDFLLVALVLVAFAFLVSWLVSLSMDGNETIRCHQLKAQSVEYPQFFLSPDEKEMCDRVGIQITASIGSSYDNK